MEKKGYVNNNKEKTVDFIHGALCHLDKNITVTHQRPVVHLTRDIHFIFCTSTNTVYRRNFSLRVLKTN